MKNCKNDAGKKRCKRRNRREEIYKNPMKKSHSISLLFTIALIALPFSDSAGDSGFCADEMATLGGIRDSHSAAANSAETDGLARFAVEEHNKKENAMLEFARVVKAKEQVVAGTLHHLTIEAIEAGKKKIYEAKVWVKPWLNFKELQEFKHAGDAEDSAPSITSSDLGVKRDGHGAGWREVPAHDPAVQDAANHAVATLQRSSNSLSPYELQEIVSSKAEVTENAAKFDMVLKVKRGSAEEKVKVEVHKNHEGGYHLNQFIRHE